MDAQEMQEEAIRKFLETPEGPTAKSRARVKKALKQAETEAASRKAKSASSSAAARQFGRALPGSLEAAYPGVPPEELYKLADKLF